MAAATLTGTRAKDSVPTGGAGPAFDVKASWGTVTVDASTEAGDIFEACKVPAGATVIGGTVYGGDGDTGIEALDIDVGWKANADEVTDVDGFGNLGVWTGDASKTAPTGNFFNFCGVLQSVGPKTFTAETVIQLYTNTAAATGAAMEVTIVVYYLYNSQ